MFPHPSLRQDAVRSLLSRRQILSAFSCLTATAPLGCLTLPPPEAAAESQSSSPPLDAESDAKQTTSASEEAITMNAWTAAAQMSPGTNIGNTLENTTEWETGWGNPVITKEYVESLARLGFKTVRLPVAWDTYAEREKILPEKMERVAEVVDWIIGADMFAVVNIHWDGGWIDSSQKEKYPQTFATFSDDAERKFRSYWQQIATHFKDRGPKLIFEGWNEETNFSGEGSDREAYATLTRVNQLFIDTVRGTGDKNAERLLVITGFHTDIEKTCNELFVLPKDTVPGKLFLSVHYYTPWQFCGLEQDAEWGKVMKTWGSSEDVEKHAALFDKMEKFSQEHDIPVFVGEYNATGKRESESRIRWLKAVTKAAIDRKMVPVLWDTGGEVTRKAPYAASPELRAVLQSL